MATKVEKIFDFWAVAEKLKETKRWKAVPQMKHKETTADHSWQLAALCFIAMKELCPDIDEEKALKIALAHDLVEAFADDVDCVLIHTGQASHTEKNAREKKAILKISKILPEKTGKEIKNLWDEYEEKATPEAKFVYALDKLESISHLVYMGHRTFHEHDDFMGTFCHEPVEGYPLLRPFHYILQDKLKIEYKKHGWKWKKKYDVPIVAVGLLQGAERLLRFAFLGEKLKQTRRFLSTKTMLNKESSAEHSWNLALLSYITASELGFKVNILHSIEIALFHDIAEALTGDIDCSLVHFGVVTKEQKHKNELKAAIKIHNMLGDNSGAHIYKYWEEYESGVTGESKFVKALDKIEGINHMLVIGHECFDHTELVAPHPINATKKYPPVIPLLRELYNRLKPEYEKHGWKWLKEYTI